MIQHQNVKNLKIFAAQFFKNTIKPLSSGVTDSKKGGALRLNKGITKLGKS